MPAKSIKEEIFPQRMFVYGTLMEGFYNYDKSLRGRVLSRTSARVQGALYHQSLKGYPAMVDGEGRVRGELLEVEDFDRMLEICDKIENFFGEGRQDNEYERRATEVEVPADEKPGLFKPILAWVYWYARSDLGKPSNPAEKVPSGDWREFMKK
ncbi:gamma-glutamylcyclotransferase [Spirochaetia bacterium]|nr:gamma-glutamylcyclotransferase [Spirochaetia bacterium]